MPYKVTAQDFACGAKQETTNNGFQVSLHMEGGVYHVGVYNAIDKVWVKAKCFHTLTEARKVFSRYTRIAKL